MNLIVPHGGPVKECKREDIGALGQALLQLPGNFEIDVEHIVAEGLYGRLGFMPKGACVVSCIHLFEHITVALSGVCLVVDPDGVEELVTAPMVRVTPAGMQRAVYVLEDAVWFTVHRADVTDPETMREQLTVKTIEEFRAAVAALPMECAHGS